MYKLINNSWNLAKREKADRINSINHITGKAVYVYKNGARHPLGMPGTV